MPEADALFNFAEHIELNKMPQTLFASDNLSGWDFFLFYFFYKTLAQKDLYDSFSWENE